MSPILEFRQATKEFRGIPAIRNIDFALNAGEIHAIVGENGAGKSTLMKVLAGVYELTSGELIFDGKPLHLKSPAEALAHGIAMVFQETNLVPSMSVAQNIYLGEEQLFNRLRGLYIQAQRFLLSLNFYVDPMALVSTLGAGKKQMVEIARAVHHHARVLIFDEPTASLTPEEKFHFFNLVRRLQRDGMSVIFISHALEEALTLVRPDHGAARRRGRGHGCDPQLRSLAACSRDGRPEFVERALSGQRRSARRVPTVKRSSACAIFPWAALSATPRSLSSRDRSPACSVSSAQDERRR